MNKKKTKKREKKRTNKVKKKLQKETQNLDHSERKFFFPFYPRKNAPQLVIERTKYIFSSLKFTF